MRFLTLCIAALLVGSQIQAQTDTIVMQPGYAEQVFYSTVTGNKFSSPIANWDLAFATDAREAGIRVNDMNGVAIYKVPILAASGWAMVDTTGISSWDKPVNSVESWMLGAFNTNSVGMFDYGWGAYNPVTHDVNGDSLYVVELTNSTGPSTFKKLQIQKKSAANVYTFRYADIDGTNEVNVSIPASSYNTQNFVYHSIRNANTISREPASLDWNLTFTRYMIEIPGVGSYPVTGVLHNIDVETAEARGIDVNTVVASAYDSNYTSMISEIGDDWKYFNGASFDIVDSLVYFVKSQDNGISKVRFLTFEGSATGVTVLGSTIITTAISEVPGTLENFAVYPTVSSNNVHVVYSMKENEEVKLTVYSIDGKMIDQKSVRSSKGLNEHLMDVSNYSSGYYVINLTSATNQLNSKFIVGR